jgi:EAL domain-containing protein (putative c-di-GMP-specific phosphodiesterase class I)
MYLLSVIALLRWQHNDKFISPVEFIPVAEKSGRIVEIGAWVLHKPCQDAVKWPFDSNFGIA